LRRASIRASRSAFQQSIAGGHITLGGGVMRIAVSERIFGFGRRAKSELLLKES
jgi:hypothetical protein